MLNLRGIWPIEGPVMVTGHTGFKGSWLILLLKELGVDVIGYSLEPKNDSIYSMLGLNGIVPEIFADIRNSESLSKFIDEHQPKAIIHLAAQPIVLESYADPVSTFNVNVMGTVNLLDIASTREDIKAIVIATTDKVYRNFNLGRKFIESDPLEGIDPYSASKVAVESAVLSWQKMITKTPSKKIISARAGNVIGGGDLSPNRIIPDCIRAHLSNETLIVRNPNSVRPWQHVLEPLTGYLLALRLGSADAYNFGPSDESDISVLEVVNYIKEQIPFTYEISTKNQLNYESSHLALNSNLARETLKWRPVYNQRQAILKTTDWWQAYLSGENIVEFSKSQVREYLLSLQSVL